jgi:hypothetical protein
MEAMAYVRGSWRNFRPLKRISAWAIFTDMRDKITVIINFMDRHFSFRLFLGFPVFRLPFGL